MIAAPSLRKSLPLREFWALLRTYLLPQRELVALMSVSLTLGIALTLVGPQTVRFSLDAAQAKRPESELLVAAGLFILSSVAQQGLAVMTSYAATRVGWSATNNLRVDLTEHCLKLDLSFRKSRTPGELIERVDGDVTAISISVENQAYRTMNAISPDLRQRIVHAVKVDKNTPEQASERFVVSPASVYRYLEQHRNQGTLQPATRTQPPRCITAEDLPRLLDQLEAQRSRSTANAGLNKQAFRSAFPRSTAL